MFHNIYRIWQVKSFFLLFNIAEENSYVLSKAFNVKLKNTAFFYFLRQNYIDSYAHFLLYDTEISNLVTF